MICSICLEENPDHILINCGHHFHKECIEQWLRIKPICPLCRRLSTTNFTYNYRNTYIKKGSITINNNFIVIKNYFSFNLCGKNTVLIGFGDIKRIEYNHYRFKITYFRNSTIKKICLYTEYPINIFNICKFHIDNNRLIQL